MTQKPIIVGVDDSPEGVRAARLGWHYAAAIGAPCRLVHVVPDLWVTLGMPQPPLNETVTADLIEGARQRLRRALSADLPAEALERVEIKVGHAAAVLADCAADAQLVVLGGHTHGPLARGLGGSTAHYLVRKVDVPVLIVALAGWPVRRVLAAVDLSHAAEPTMTAARGLAQSLDARLRLLHVFEPVHAAVAGRVDEPALYQAALRDYERLAVLGKVEPPDRVMRRGVPADTITAEAADWSADMVVVGSHGKGWVERMLVGSVTERLMASLPTSLLIVPTRRVEQPTEWVESPTRVRHGTVMI